MAMEAIQAVTALEEEIRKQKEGAAAQNKQRLLEAQRAARLLVEQSRQQAEGEAKEQMARRKRRPGSGPGRFCGRRSGTVRPRRPRPGDGWTRRPPFWQRRL